MNVASLERKLLWTRAALAIISPIAGLCLLALSIKLLIEGDATAAGVWMIAVMVSQQVNR